MDEVTSTSISMRLGKLQFHKSGKFRVLQCADIQDGPTVSADTVRLLARACDVARPDLVIFTGNQIAGYHSAYAKTYRKRRWNTALSQASDFGGAITSAAQVLLKQSLQKSLQTLRRGRGDDARRNDQELQVVHTSQGHTNKGESDSTISLASVAKLNSQLTNGSSMPLSHEQSSGNDAAEMVDGQDERTMNNLAEMYAFQQEQLQYSRKRNLQQTRELVRRSAEQFLQPLIERHIPFAVTYGNHDFQCGIDVEEMDAIFREFSGCLNPESSSHIAYRAKAVPLSGMSKQIAYPHSAGTFALPIMDLNDNPVLGLMLVNSGDYDQFGGYAPVGKSTLQWMHQFSNHVNFSSLVFQHMPIREYYNILRAVPKNHAYAIQGYRNFEHQWYELDSSKVLAGSFLGEGISCPDRDTGEYGVLRHGKFIGMATGHDHRNGFVGYDGDLMFAATPTSGFGSYGPPASERAVRLFEFDIRHPNNPRSQLLTFGELLGGRSSRSVHTFAMSHLPHDAQESMAFLRKPTTWGSVVVDTIKALSRRRKIRKMHDKN